MPVKNYFHLELLSGSTFSSIRQRIVIKKTRNETHNNNKQIFTSRSQFFLKLYKSNIVFEIHSYKLLDFALLVMTAESDFFVYIVFKIIIVDILLCRISTF